MIKINIFGDFKCDDISRLEMDESLINLLNSGCINALNFEAPLRAKVFVPIEKNGPHICNDSKAPDYLIKNGFNLFSLANNHIYDYGAESLLLTKDAFPAGLTIGAGSWEEAYRPIIIEKEGKRLGFIAVTHHEFGVLYEESYHEEDVGAAWMLHPIIDELIVETKRKCDFLFIISHCGLEHEYYPMPEVRTLYRHWINMGADGVIASHAHTPQPWEMYKGKPIAYNLGNFCFDTLPGQEPQKYWYWSLVVSIIIINNDIKFDVQYCHYNQQTGQLKIIGNDSLFNTHIKEIIETYGNEDKYIQLVNKQCVKYKMNYERLPMMAGFFRLSPYLVIRKTIKWLIGKKNSYRVAPLQNLIECETHRWAVSRILDCKNDDNR